jgi:hypothetical protein
MLNNIHTELLAKALDKILGKAQEGSIAFVRCLDPSVVSGLCISPAFDLKEWDFFGVVAEADADNALITADMAVEIREDKKDAALLLVDVNAAGAGMDGIYNAGREIAEKELFEAANKEAQKRIPHGWATLAKKAVAKARKLGGHTTISPWREFDFYSACTTPEDISTALVKLGLWPIAFDKKPDMQELDTSVLLVERLFLQARSNVAESSRKQRPICRSPLIRLIRG